MAKSEVSKEVTSRKWPKPVEDRVSKFADDKGLKGSQKEEFLEECYAKYNSSKVPIYEPVGIMVAHSMGEPATQMVLRTKHYAGAAEVSIGSGIERFEELVDARSKTKLPTMTIYLRKDAPRDDKSMIKYVRELVLRSLSNLAEVKENMAESKITIHYKKDLLKELDINSIIIADRIKGIVKAKPKEIKDGLEYSFGDVTLATIRKYFLKIRDINVLGIDGIHDAVIEEENGEKVIKTKGTNLKHVVSLDFVDSQRTYTNDIFETYKVLGIEAARNLLVSEIDYVYKMSKISVDSRHVFLLADSMCFDGSVKGVVRTGIVSTKASPLARAAFEQTEKVIFDAAFEQEEEKFEGVVENVMAGLPIKVGVGKVDVVMEFKNKD